MKSFIWLVSGFLSVLFIAAVLNVGTPQASVNVQEDSLGTEEYVILNVERLKAEADIEEAKAEQRQASADKAMHDASRMATIGEIVEEVAGLIPVLALVIITMILLIYFIRKR